MLIGLLREPDDSLDSKLIAALSTIWKKQGHQIISVEPVESEAACDLLFVHVDLSVLPPEFVEFIATQKVPVINAKAHDIRKTLVSSARVLPGDDWVGPIIVKSVENYMGKPEIQRKKKALKKQPLRYLFRRLLQPGTFNPLPFKEYPVLENSGKVPSEWWQRDDLLVERFLPERDGELYVLRKYVFLGSKFILNIASGRDPLVSTQTQIESRTVHENPPPEVLALREKLGLDYGKIDYGIVEGRCVIYDANKTIGARHPNSPRILKFAELLADGLNDFVEAR